jgi:hypothetical protein
LFPHIDIQNTLIIFAVACLGRLNAIGKQAGIQLGCCVGHRYLSPELILLYETKYRNET